MTKYVSLGGNIGKGHFLIIDNDDYDRVIGHSWCMNNRGYVSATIKGKSISIHQFILGYVDGEADHINHNKLDNRKSNLRHCTTSQNNMNHLPKKRIYKGTFPLKTGKWKAHIMKDRQSIYLGHYDTPEDAARAYDMAAKKLFGSFAQLNFPDE